MSAELMKSKFVSRTARFVRPSVSLWYRLSLKLLHGLLSNFSCGFPWATCPDFFHFWKKKFFLYFLGIFFIFVNMGPYGSQNFKTLLLPQISFESFQFFSEISSQWSWQKYCFGFLKFWVFDFSGILFVFINMGPYGSQNFKTLLLLQITFESFHPFPEFSSQLSSQVLFWIFEILSFRFLMNFWISTLHPMGKPKTSIIWKTSDRRAKQSEIWASGVSIQCTQGTFDTYVVKVILGSFGVFLIFKNLVFRKR